MFMKFINFLKVPSKLRTASISTASSILGVTLLILMYKFGYKTGAKVMRKQMKMPVIGNYLWDPTDHTNNAVCQDPKARGLDLSSTQFVAFEVKLLDKVEIQNTSKKPDA